jgi:hypothetical protein
MTDGSATIHLERQPGGWVDRARAYTLLVDGREMGQVKAGEALDAEVPAGAHEVQLKIDWARSLPQTLDLGSGETANFSCAPNANPLTALWWVSVGRKRYIRLDREDAGT